MSHPSPPSRTINSQTFNPASFFDDWSQRSSELLPRGDDDFRGSIIRAFGIEEDENERPKGKEGNGEKEESEEGGNGEYVYHAMSSVSLRKVQLVIDHRGIGTVGLNSLHAWYMDSEGTQVRLNDVKIPAPPPRDVGAYTSIFSSTTSTSKALIDLEKNAKKGSIRAGVADHLASSRFLPSPGFTVPKMKTPHVNPYFDYWQWSCRNLEWAGPDANTVKIRQSHHVLPIFYHHFGCVCPSYEALETIKQVSKQRPVIDIGSGNGYWTLMLRQMGVDVRAVDSLESVWRTTWISDTVVTDGVAYIKKNDGGKDAVLLMVYPVAESGFTNKVLKAYKGAVLCMVGTQNRNGYTGFADTTINDYMAEKMPRFRKTLQIALPSFAGKDDALFVFEKSA